MRRFTFKEKYEDTGGLKEAGIVVEGQNEAWKRNLRRDTINELPASHFYLDLAILNCQGKKETL